MTNEANAPEATIRLESDLVTLINVFTVDPPEQQHLIEAWQQATEEVMRQQPGFISASVHRSADGTKVINYAQWKSGEALSAMFENPEASARMAKLAEIGTPSPVICEVVSVHRP
jgi:heme-degrading monooxygenase HmoA